MSTPLKSGRVEIIQAPIVSGQGVQFFAELCALARWHASLTRQYFVDDVLVAPKPRPGCVHVPQTVQDALAAREALLADVWAPLVLPAAWKGRGAPRCRVQWRGPALIFSWKALAGRVVRLVVTPQRLEEALYGRVPDAIILHDWREGALTAPRRAAMMRAQRAYGPAPPTPLIPYLELRWNLPN